ncbi:hypothetical protein BFV95_1845 [Alteromonas macleodii]|uniref:Uncharacterized protein n=1 Tax=Alteromonas macleodii TaxID=28108 RepID=A0AB36FT01_ALTMA|nr:hypothetical protein BFV95_1845 [Alteromonas macleodii]
MCQAAIGLCCKKLSIYKDEQQLLTALKIRNVSVPLLVWSRKVISSIRN